MHSTQSVCIAHVCVCACALCVDVCVVEEREVRLVHSGCMARLPAGEKASRRSLVGAGLAYSYGKGRASPSHRREERAIDMESRLPREVEGAVGGRKAYGMEGDGGDGVGMSDFSLSLPHSVPAAHPPTHTIRPLTYDAHAHTHTEHTQLTEIVSAVCSVGRNNNNKGCFAMP